METKSVERTYKLNQNKHEINIRLLAIIVTSHYTECLIIKKNKHVTGLRPNSLMAYSRKSCKTFSTNSLKNKKCYILPRTSHNVYTTIIIPWISESSLPRALRCIKRNEIFSQHGRNQIFASRKHPLHTTAAQERGLVSTRQAGTGKKRREGGHVTDPIMKEHKKKDRTWLPRDS
jgi:hypothetical protein